MNNSVKCIKCNFENNQQDEECANCGAKLYSASSDTTATFMVPTQTELREGEIEVGSIKDGEEAVLVVKKGPVVGQRLPVDLNETIIGRDPKCDIFLNDITVSRRHAKITAKDNSGIYIKDTGSLNGTYVNNKLTEEAKLANNDEIQIGKFVLVFLSKRGDNGKDL